MLDKVLSFYTKYFAVWVIVFGAVAYFFPEPFMSLKGGMSWFFALTMFGIGAVLSMDDFKEIAKKPLTIILGTAAQYTIMPLGAFLLAKAFDLPDVIAVGLILTGSAPGAMASNVMCYIAKADTAYSVSLTALSSLLCPILTPGLTLLLAGSYMEVDFWPLFLTVIQMMIAPLLVGLMVKYFLRDKVERISKVFPAISVTFIIFICSVILALNREYLGMITGAVLLATIILNLYGMTMGYSVGKVFRLGRRRQKSLCIEIGMQNAGLGTVLALKHFNEQTALPAALFVFICILTASVLVEFWARTAKQDHPTDINEPRP